MKNAPVRHRVEYGCYLVFKGFLRALPHAAARRVGVGLGALGYHLDQGHRRVALRNLELAMPELDPKARRRLTAACFRHFGGALGDVISSSRFDLTELCRRFTYEGWEYLDEAASAGKGVLGLSAHLGYWEASALPIGVYKESLHVVGRPADNPHLDRELVHLRERFGNQNVPKQRAVRKLLQVMAAGGWAGVLMDQRVQAREGISLPFFGQPALTTPILAKLSLRTGAPVLAMFAYPEPGGRYRFVAHPPIYPEGEGDEAVAALTTKYLALIEREVRKRPEMWLWMHRRWEGRGRPDD